MDERGSSTALQTRTKEFAIRCLRLAESLPRTKTADAVSRQLIRSALSVGANYRAACHARSKADFVSKMGIVEEEADESLYWMEMLVHAGLVKPERINTLMDEAREIVCMVVASIKTARSRARTA